MTMAGLTKEDVIHVCYGMLLQWTWMDLCKKNWCYDGSYVCRKLHRDRLCVWKILAQQLLHVHHHMLYNLAETIAEMDKVDDMKLKVGIHGAEPWTEEMKKKIEDILHIECFDIYGLCEITGPGVAMDCKQHNGLHINHDFFYPGST